MGSPTVIAPQGKACIQKPDVPQPNHDLDQFVEEPAVRNRASRGVITGVLVGAGLWGAILVLVGVIKL